MKITGRLECPGYGGFTTAHTTDQDNPPMATVALMACLLMLSAHGNGHLAADRLFTITIEADGRLIYATTMGKEPVPPFYDAETLALIEEGFED